MKEHKTVYDRYKGADNSIFSKIAGASKEEYYNFHKEEIDKYIRAKSILKKLSGSEKIESLVSKFSVGARQDGKIANYGVGSKIGRAHV